MHKEREVWCHVELVLVRKDNCVSDYKVEDETISNGGGHITYVIIRMWVMMDAEDFNSEVGKEDI